MDAPPNNVLARMLERLLASMLSGPNLNCRPHSSRQRIDLAHLERLDDLSPVDVLRGLLETEVPVRLTPRVTKPPAENGAAKKASKKFGAADVSGAADAPADAAKESSDGLGADRSASRAESKSPQPDAPPEAPSSNASDADAAAAKIAEKAWADQQGLLAKIGIVIDDARTYEQDTGVHVLNVGFPLLSLPPGASGRMGAARNAAKRILAPIAFIPVTITLRSRPTATVEIACKGEGIDRVTPNQALLAWLDQEYKQSSDEVFTDETGANPWREIVELVRFVGKTLDIPVPAEFVSGEAAPDTAGEPPRNTERRLPGDLMLQPAPRADEAESRASIVPAAVLGLFPTNNQGLVRDTQAMLAGDALDGPVESFLKVGTNLDRPPPASYDHELSPTEHRPRRVADERFVAQVDPCQARAVRLARECRGLVVHGPPGTGKSQTITNIIADHLARGERVLMVCDKRTALDVVANRLDHMGLGALIALVHDPRRDQRELYRVIRDQLDALTDARANPRAATQVNRLNRELQKLHDELTATRAALMNDGSDDRPSFQHLVGKWLAIDVPPQASLAAESVAGVTLDDLDEFAPRIGHVLRRSEEVSLRDNPWRTAAGGTLASYLARPMNDVRRAMETCAAAAHAADAAADESIEPFAATPGVIEQAAARNRLADRLEPLFARVAPEILTRWKRADASVLAAARDRLAETRAARERLDREPLDRELALVIRDGLPKMSKLGEQIGAIESYMAVADRWYAVLCVSRRAKANQVASEYGLPPSRESAAKLQVFLRGLRTRITLAMLDAELHRRDFAIPADDSLASSLEQHEAVVTLLVEAAGDPALAPVMDKTREALGNHEARPRFVEGLRRSTSRATTIAQVENALVATSLFDDGWRKTCGARLRCGERLGDEMDDLAAQLPGLETVMRIRDELNGELATGAPLPQPLRTALAAATLLPVDAEGTQAALAKGVIAAEISARLQANRDLLAIDGVRLEESFSRYQHLEIEKREAVRDAMLHLWTTRQQERLLASTLSRLSGQGADLRRRLALRGERAMRLRQVIEIGQAIEGGDPLFDLRPVWMASPETVAQLFARTPQFDVVIFDEASQCRLEEALPVLTRAKRVVIAGDPKQLPPTRFFETAIAQSEDEAIESEQQLFEQQQGETEDLLAAALGIEIQQCYLDVHYRSRNADLIEFSNRNFYSARLQPIPGHPQNRVRQSPIRLYRAAGIYDKRANRAEAKTVAGIVRDLLRRATPPSIGVACFNLTQRDAIVEELDALSATDEEFAGRLAEARSRRGEASFEGLFVKNLENVQGDERDHIIISTTYGPDPQGRFYRRFGPLGRTGGGRRLNVLVTRARHEVHLVTSIPVEAYRNLPPVPTGETPGGAWLLFAYLAYAEAVEHAYRREANAKANLAEHVDAMAMGDLASGKDDECDEASLGEMTNDVARLPILVYPSRWPTPLASSLASYLARRSTTGSSLYWGNDGFCVDVALAHPERPDDVTIGVLCDMARFGDAEDPVSWDVFRTNILAEQGWRLRRVWSPQLFRDAEGVAKQLTEESAKFVANEPPHDAIPVERKPT